jgi:hypothetical protein
LQVAATPFDLVEGSPSFPSSFFANGYAPRFPFDACLSAKLRGYFFQSLDDLGDIYICHAREDRQ